MAAPLCALALVVAACGDDDDGGEEGTETTEAAGDATGTTEGETAGAGLLPDNGPCDESLDPYPVGIITVFESPILSLIDQVTALEASVDAFNGRGGVGGHCMDLTTCDSGGDPNAEADCARQFADAGIVATLNDTTSFNPQAVIDVFTPLGLPRVGISPGTQELNSPITYAFGAGGAGTTFMMVPPLTRDGITQLAMIHVDTPQIQGLIAVIGPMLEAYGAELVATIPVPAGTTDFQQFILAAEDAGAEGVVLPLGENEALQVLRAAEQLGTDMRFSTSLGTFGLADIQEFGDFAGQIVLNAELPPITADVERWPILAQAIEDLEASGEDELQRDQIKSSPFRSWVSVYALVTIVEQFGNPDDISREAITAAFNAATDVDLFDLTPPWTPNATSEGIFSRVSQPYYFVVDYDAEEESFVVHDEQLNVLEELAANIEYPQPQG